MLIVRSERNMKSMVVFLLLVLRSSTKAFSTHSNKVSNLLESLFIQQHHQHGRTNHHGTILAMSSTPLLREPTTTTTSQPIPSSSRNVMEPTIRTRKNTSMIQKARTTTVAVPPIKAVTDMIWGRSPSFATTFTTTSNNNNNNDTTMTSEYQRGLITIGLITLLFASNSPVLHAAFQGSHPPPVVLLNAAVSVIALVGLLLGGETLESNTPPLSASRVVVIQQQQQQQPLRNQQQEQQLEQVESTAQNENASTSSSFFSHLSPPLWLQGGLELGVWKFLGTTANLYGLSLTSASHAAFLIQLTTLIVPVVQGMMGVAIPKRIQWSVVLALAGVVAFALDPITTGGSAAVDAAATAVDASRVLWGDALCAVAAGFYATYDLRLFAWGKQVAPRQLITAKIATQAFLSVMLLLAVASGVGSNQAAASLSSFGEWWHDSLEFFQSNPVASSSSSSNWRMVVPCVLWSGVAVNAIAPFLQVGGQQVVGPTRCQTIYASQPLWAALLSYLCLGETVGLQGLVGATAFGSALFLAATTEAPDPNCPQITDCEV